MNRTKTSKKKLSRRGQATNRQIYFVNYVSKKQYNLSITIMEIIV